MKQLFTAFIALTAFMAQAQVQETRKAAPFTRIDARNGIEVILSNSETPSVKAEAGTTGDLNSIITVVEGNTLKVSLKTSENTGEKQPLKVYVASNDITGLKASSGATVKVAGEYKVNGLAVDMASGASFKGMVNCRGAFKLDARAGSNFDGVVVTDLFHGDFKGGAVVKIAGMANNSVINASNGATCLGANFNCVNAKVNAITTATVVINAKESIKAATDESASITYYGNPANSQLGQDCYAIRKNSNTNITNETVNK